jgi:hypothetical protein
VCSSTIWSPRKLAAVAAASNVATRTHGGETLTAREDWDRVADSLGGPALKLKLHVEEAAGGSAEETKSALAAVSEGVEAAFDGLKAAIADPAMKQDVQDVAAGFRDAVSNTFAEFSSKVRRPGDK